MAFGYLQPDTAHFGSARGSLFPDTMAPPRRLSPQSVWDTSAVMQAFKEEGIKPLHAVRMWG